MVMNHFRFPKDWVSKTLYELSDRGFQNGLFYEVERKGKGIPIINVGDLYGSVPISNDDLSLFNATPAEMSIFAVQSGDIFFTRSSIVPSGIAMCNVYLSTTDASVVFDSHVIKYSVDKTQANPLFLTLQCRMPYAKQQLIGCAKTATMTTIDQKGIGNCSIFLPSLPEQKAIAETLTVFDTHIANLTELIEKKKAIREGALEDLVSGKTRLSGFTDKWKEMQLGKIRKTKRGKRLVRSQLQQEQRVDSYPVFQNSLEPLGFYNEYSCPAGSVYVIAAGNAGDIGYSEIAFWAADDCYYYEQSNDINQKYLYYYLLFNQKSLSEQTRRTSIPRLSRDILDNLIIQLPKVDEQEAIAQILTDMDNEIHSLEDECDKIKQIREGAMDDLLTGKVRLTD